MKIIRNKLLTKIYVNNFLSDSVIYIKTSSFDEITGTPDLSYLQGVEEIKVIDTEDNETKELSYGNEIRSSGGIMEHVRKYNEDDISIPENIVINDVKKPTSRILESWDMDVPTLGKCISKASMFSFSKCQLGTKDYLAAIYGIIEECLSRKIDVKDITSLLQFFVSGAMKDSLPQKTFTLSSEKTYKTILLADYSKLSPKSIVISIDSLLDKNFQNSIINRVNQVTSILTFLHGNEVWKIGTITEEDMENMLQRITDYDTKVKKVGLMNLLTVTQYLLNQVCPGGASRIVTLTNQDGEQKMFSYEELNPIVNQYAERTTGRYGKVRIMNY